MNSPSPQDPDGSQLRTPPVEGDRKAALHLGMIARTDRRTRASGEIIFPAVPSLTGHFVDVLAAQFAGLGRAFSPVDLEALGRLIEAKAREAFSISSGASVWVRYNTASNGSMRIDYGVASSHASLEEQFAHLAKARKPPLFGSQADAMVMNAARVLPRGASVLDIGAGTGRNSLPLARLGLAVDAAEPAPALSSVLEADAAKEGLSVRIVQAGISIDSLPVESGKYSLVVVAQVTSHFRGAAELRALFVACAKALRKGGHAVVSVFLTIDDYRPDQTARELGQVFWTTFFTRDELAEALRGLPLGIAEEQDAFEYERQRQPAEFWPPTGWFEEWSQGEDLFAHQEKSPISLRWLLLERTSGEIP